MVDIEPDAFTKNYILSMTEEERYLLGINSYRALRNQLLKKTDILMNQTDRYTTEQIEQLKLCRQELSDMINNNQSNLKNGFPMSFPIKPDFLN